jgi:hypothetical protein
MLEGIHSIHVSILTCLINLPSDQDFRVFLFFFFVCFFFLPPHGVRLSPVCTAATTCPVVPALDYDHDDDCGAIGGMRIGRRNLSTGVGGNLPQYHKSHMT